MPQSNADLMSMARKSLHGKWGSAVAGFLVYIVISCLQGAVPVIGWMLSFIVSGPLTIGCYIFFLAIIRGREPRIGMLFDGFNSFLSAFSAYIIVLIFTILWTLLLIVPGIIAAFSYSMTFFILADEPGMDALAAIRKSKEMMNGSKYRLFCLGCRFIGWFLLGVLSLGIGFIWIGPYFMASISCFYNDFLSKEQPAAGSYTGYTVDGRRV